MKKGACSPAPPPSKIRYLMFPVPNYYLCSSVSIKSWPYFPRSREINAIFPVRKTPGRASSILNFQFSLNKIRRLQLLLVFLITILLIAKKHKRSRSNELYYNSSGSSSKQEKDERKLLVGPLSSVRESRVYLTPQK